MRAASSGDTSEAGRNTICCPVLLYRMRGRQSIWASVQGGELRNNLSPIASVGLLTVNTSCSSQRRAARVIFTRAHEDSSVRLFGGGVRARASSGGR